MKIFNQSKPWIQGVNFVDEENHLIGYNLSIDCCESPGWFISKYPFAHLQGNHFSPADAEIMHNSDCKGKIIDLPDWFIDRDYLCKVEGGVLNNGKMYIFKVFNPKSKEEKYLHIYNCQSGFYSHELNYFGNTEFL